MSKRTYNKPSEVVAELGRVLVDGPDSIDLAFSPDAAVETGARLIDQGEKAQKSSEGPRDQESS